MCLEILIIDTVTRFGSHVSGEIPVHIMKTCWLGAKLRAHISQGCIAEMLLAVGMVPFTFILSADGHLLQHGAVSFPGRKPIAELSICLDTVVIVLEEADKNAWSSKFLHLKKPKNMCPRLCLCLFMPEQEARPLRFEGPGTYLCGTDTCTAFYFSFNNEIK